MSEARIRAATTGTVIDGEIFASDDNAMLPTGVELRRQV
jgi:hypothetical protein